MSKKLPKIYDITYFDEAGEEIPKNPGALWPLDSETENEVQFMESAQRMNAARYSVHLMNHDEIKQQLKAYRKPLVRRVSVEITDTFRITQTVMAIAEANQQMAISQK